MSIENEFTTPEKLRETAELRLLLKFLSDSAKDNIIKGIAMFEAGYSTGYVDGLHSKKKRILAEDVDEKELFLEGLMCSKRKGKLPSS